MVREGSRLSSTSSVARWTLLGVVGLAATACTASPTASAPASVTSSPAPTIGLTPAPSLSPAPPPKPKLSEARLDGTYKMTYVLIRNSVPGAAKIERSKWHVAARCKSGGACDVAIKSTNKWSAARVSFLNGKYRFSRTFPANWTCGGGPSSPGGYNISASGNYSMQVARMKLIDGEWIATQVKGILATKGNRGCGFSGAPIEQQAITGVLLH